MRVEPPIPTRPSLPLPVVACSGSMQSRQQRRIGREPKARNAEEHRRSWEVPRGAGGRGRSCSCVRSSAARLRSHHRAGTVGQDPPHCTRKTGRGRELRSEFERCRTARARGLGSAAPPTGTRGVHRPPPQIWRRAGSGEGKVGAGEVGS